MIRNDNYLVVHGWMINELGLKGNELLVYSCIFGFSQDGESWFTGSAKYLAEWCNVSRQTIHNVLNGLVEKGMILKQEQNVNGVKFCYYKAVPLAGYQKSLQGVSKNLTGGCQKTLHNNIDTNIKDNNIDICKEVIEYLNNRAQKNYRYNTGKTRSLINARVKEGFGLDDFKRVIDIKCAQWLNNPKMNIYLRPETLFGTKFEGYLNEPEPDKGIPDWYSIVDSTPADDELLKKALELQKKGLKKVTKMYCK